MTYDSDVEDRSRIDERTSMLGETSSESGLTSNKENTSSLWIFLRFFGGGIYAPDPSTYDPIEILLNTQDPDERDELTVRWKDNKLSELNFVGVVVCIFLRFEFHISC